MMIYLPIKLKNLNYIDAQVVVILQCVTNLEDLHLRFDIEIWAAKESHGLSRFSFLIFSQVEQRGFRHEDHRYTEYDRRDATETGYRDHVSRKTGAVCV